MGFPSKFARAPPLTAPDFVGNEKASPGLDPEKSSANDEPEAFTQSHQRHVVPEIERRVIRKLDFRVVPLVTALYVLAFLDRSNIGNARIAGMTKDLKLVGNDYQWLLTIFYIAYIIFEWQSLMWKVVPPHMWLAFTVFGWGVIATCQAATQTWSGEMALRFFLGIFEAGFGPGVPYLLSFFYLRHEVGVRIAIFLSAAPLATSFSGALAYGITSGHSHLANWRLLFLVEGLPTLCMVPVAYFLLPDTPDQARFLTEGEKVVAKARGVRQVGGTKRVGGIVWKEVGLALLDLKCWFTAFMYFSCNVGFSSLPVFLPTILSDMGFNAIDSQGLTAPPFFLSFLVTISSTWVADRTQQRGYTIMVLTTIGGIGYILLATVKTVGVRYFGTFLAASGIFPSIANILPWVTNNQGSDSRRGAGIMLLNLIGQCGPLLGTNVFPTNESPRYIKGMAISAAFTFFTGVLAFGLRCLLVYENKKLDQKYGSNDNRVVNQPGAEGQESEVGEENYGPTFRYIL
ncbi:hypothetical protein ABVK25_001583 [Lepraria finkii]|uniref:Major facilitator superfamily (MFS) profile domain-containing protein n=1 Tax=Lepraria finkii TaxID=1340010 RepID=A0ABR4BLQ3_9LECA